MRRDRGGESGDRSMMWRSEYDPPEPAKSTWTIAAIARERSESMATLLASVGEIGKRKRGGEASSASRRYTAPPPEARIPASVVPMRCQSATISVGLTAISLFEGETFSGMNSAFSDHIQEYRRREVAGDVLHGAVHSTARSAHEGVVDRVVPVGAVGAVEIVDHQISRGVDAAPRRERGVVTGLVVGVKFAGVDRRKPGHFEKWVGAAASGSEERFAVDGGAFDGPAR